MHEGEMTQTTQKKELEYWKLLAGDSDPLFLLDQTTLHRIPHKRLSATRAQGQGAAPRARRSSRSGVRRRRSPSLVYIERGLGLD